MKCPKCGKDLTCYCADGDLVMLGGDFAEYECKDCGISLEFRRELSIVGLKEKEDKQSIECKILKLIEIKERAEARIRDLRYKSKEQETREHGKETQGLHELPRSMRDNGGRNMPKKKNSREDTSE